MTIKELKEKAKETGRKVKDWTKENGHIIGYVCGCIVTTIVSYTAMKIWEQDETVTAIIAEEGSNGLRIGYDEEQNCNYLDLRNPNLSAITNHGRTMKLPDVFVGMQIDRDTLDYINGELAKLNFDKEETE